MRARRRNPSLPFTTIFRGYTPWGSFFQYLSRAFWLAPRPASPARDRGWHQPHDAVGARELSTGHLRRGDEHLEALHFLVKAVSLVPELHFTPQACFFLFMIALWAMRRMALILMNPAESVWLKPPSMCMLERSWS